MTLINITGKMNRKNSRINIGSFSAKILGGLAITALMAAAVSPLSARPMSADESATPLVKEVIKEVPIIQEVIKEVAVTATPAQQRHRKCFPNMAGSST